MQIKLLKYTGNGVGDRAVTGVGFMSDLIILKRESSVSGGGGLIWTSTLTEGQTKNMRDGLSGGYIKTVTSDGFTVGTHQKVNSNGAAYHALCVRAHVSDMSVGSYTGNANDSRNITGVGFEPAIVIIYSEESFAVMFRVNTSSGDETCFFRNLELATNHIQSLLSDGFQIGSASSINKSGVTHHWAAFKEVEGFVKTIGYTGNGNDNRTITGTGFDPDSAIIKGDNTVTAYWHPTTIGGAVDLSLQIAQSGGADSNQIQALITDGYQVGSGSGVNSNGTVYRGFKLKEGNTVTGGGAGATRRRPVMIF